ncbi:hypothetical protein MCOR25_008788 [Pyricularia grisea]|uniref:Pyrichalasin C-18 hydroxylase n=2 Tax=Pyricularia grisea TaxID=148305 RepID=PYID_PYRGI|nr:hypothetical protein PgNI_10624 [Pyricularia grisea]A0A4P8W744.1 RecName: Full=Pyrichalasin C-18 hydroxylase; AltName: Full=Cytochrome P450 monooxygenase pyiD; AltName: Full=Pyrichalasin H biosynthesis cluster protein D [Pyricularia grisea]KAI6354004.1 hypothetical protein MCOR25_008788 [Pyricularia grisea]QCS37517.1 PyiD [Pyricularia grisea]TLD07674.1 hypothetical protein PgNI_10624 [Pyricularia grisea]
MFLSIKRKIIEPYLVIRQSLAPLKLSRWQLTKIMARTAFDGLPSGTLIVLAALSLALLVAVLRIKSQERTRSKEIPGLPVVKRNHLHYLDIVREGRELYPGQPFMAVNKRHSLVVFPPSCFNEIKRLPAHTASAKKFFNTTNYGDWSHVGEESPELIKSVIADLTRSLPARVHTRQDECRDVFDEVVGRRREWKEFPLLMTTFEIITQINACSFVGKTLATNRSWVRSVMMLPVFIHVGVMLLDACPLIVRPFMAYLTFLPSIKNRWDLTRMLAPVLKKDLEEYHEAKDKKEFLRPRAEGKVPFTGFLLSHYKSAQASLKQLISDYIHLSFDSTPNTAAVMFHALCELAIHPEAVEALRQELDEVMVDGKLPPTHLQELRKMDSFLRECFRLHPFGIFTLQRRVEQPVQLSVGPLLPPGTLMAVDGQAIDGSSELWPNPEKFDVYRFYNLRQKLGNENQYHFATTSPDSPGWGDGTQACPGRFFAVNTLKIAMAHFLRNYDIEIKPECLPLKTKPMPSGFFSPDDRAIARIRART